MIGSNETVRFSDRNARLEADSPRGVIFGTMRRNRDRFEAPFEALCNP